MKISLSAKNVVHLRGYKGVPQCNVGTRTLRATITVPLADFPTYGDRCCTRCMTRYAKLTKNNNSEMAPSVKATPAPESQKTTMLDKTKSSPALQRLINKRMK